MLPRLLLTLALLLAATLSGGCLKRTISVTTEPPGAVVWINDVECGRTPFETDFTFYGKYDVRIRLEGYEPILTKAVADTPIEEQPGIDILGELAPVQFHDVVRWNWKLTPLVERTEPKEETEADLLARANDLRTRQSPVWTTGRSLAEDPEPTAGGKPPPPTPEPPPGKKGAAH